MGYRNYTNPTGGYGGVKNPGQGYAYAKKPMPDRRTATSLFAYNLIDPAVLVKRRREIIKIFFDMNLGKVDDVDFTINEWSGNIAYLNAKKLYAEKAPKVLFLPPTKNEATEAALNFIRKSHDAFARNAFLFEPDAAGARKEGQSSLPFNLLPDPKWLKHDLTLAVKNQHEDAVDHWLVRFGIEIEAPDKKIYPVLDASIEVRVGMALAGTFDYEILAYTQRWKPLCSYYTIEPYLPDTGNPVTDNVATDDQEHINPHVAAKTRLCYMLLGENQRQHNLLPYEISGEGHHSLVLPASQQSIWIDFFFTDNSLFALIQGVSSKISAQWQSFPLLYFNLDENFDIVPTREIQEATLTPVVNLLDKTVFLAAFKGPLLGKEIALMVKDDEYGNSLLQHQSFGIVPMTLDQTFDIDLKAHEGQNHHSLYA